jgi:hypothetical protein
MNIVAGHTGDLLPQDVPARAKQSFTLDLDESVIDKTVTQSLGDVVAAHKGLDDVVYQGAVPHRGIRRASCTRRMRLSRACVGTKKDPLDVTDTVAVWGEHVHPAPNVFEDCARGALNWMFVHDFTSLMRIVIHYICNLRDLQIRI